MQTSNEQQLDDPITTRQKVVFGSLSLLIALGTGALALSSLYLVAEIASGSAPEPTWTMQEARFDASIWVGLVSAVISTFFGVVSLRIFGSDALGFVGDAIFWGVAAGAGLVCLGAPLLALYALLDGSEDVSLWHIAMLPTVALMGAAFLREGYMRLRPPSDDDAADGA